MHTAAAATAVSTHFPYEFRQYSTTVRRALHDFWGVASLACPPGGLPGGRSVLWLVRERLWYSRSGPVSYIVATREFAVVVGALLGFLVLKEPLTFRKALGILAITLGLILVKLA